MSLDIAEKETSPVGPPPTIGQWLQFLPRWALILAATSLVLPLTYVGGLGQQASDIVLGPEFVELLQAVRNPTMFRLVWTIDAVIWLMLGGSLLIFSGLLRQHAPLSASFIAFCGAAQLFGALGSFLRLDGTSDLAFRYMTAAPAQQQMQLEAFRHLTRVIKSANHIGVLLQGLGFLLTAGSVFSLKGFPRWLATWLAVPGVLAITQFVRFITGAQYMFVLNIIGLLVGNIALNVALAITLWHPSTTLLAAIARADNEN